LTVTDGARVFIVREEARKTARVGAAEAVDGLVRVADDEYALAAPAPRADQAVLHHVHVLKLVHQQVAEALHWRPVRVFKQCQRIRDDIVKVRRALRPEPLTVRFVNALRHVGALGRLQCAVLEERYAAQHVARGGGQPLFLQYLLYERQQRGLVRDG